jgi:segregation and condensation protein B
LKASEEKCKLTEEQKIKKELAIIEAALYVSGRPLDLKTLGPLINTRSKKKVQSIVMKLIKDYNNRNTSLEILELEDQRFVLQLKTEYASEVRRLAIRPLLTDGPLRTLAYIAYRQPVMQKQVIEARGTHAYFHIKELLDIGLIELERKGRNKVLKATVFFADYFGLSHNFRTMKSQLHKIFNNITKTTI